jgi:hypothetical protein
MRVDRESITTASAAMAHIVQLHLARGDVAGRLGQNHREWELPVPRHQLTQLLPGLACCRAEVSLTIHGRWRGDSVWEEQVMHHEGKVEEMRSSRRWQPPARP